jgi:hypothetical protein
MVLDRGRDRGGGHRAWRHVAGSGGPVKDDETIERLEAAMFSVRAGEAGSDERRRAMARAAHDCVVRDLARTQSKGLGATVSAALADACLAKGLSRPYYQSADEELDKILARLAVLREENARLREVKNAAQRLLAVALGFRGSFAAELRELARLLSEES